MPGEYKALVKHLQCYGPRHFLKTEEQHYTREFLKRLAAVLHNSEERNLLIQDFSTLVSISIFVKMDFIWQDMGLIMDCDPEVLLFLSKFATRRESSRFLKYMQEEPAVPAQSLYDEETPDELDYLQDFKSKLTPLKTDDEDQNLEEAAADQQQKYTQDEQKQVSETEVLRNTPILMNDEPTSQELPRKSPETLQTLPKIEEPEAIKQAEQNLPLYSIHAHKRDQSLQAAQKAYFFASEAHQLRKPEVEKWHVASIISHYKAAYRENETLLELLTSAELIKTATQKDQLTVLQAAQSHKRCLLKELDRWNHILKYLAAVLKTQRKNGHPSPSAIPPGFEREGLCRPQLQMASPMAYVARATASVQSFMVTGHQADLLCLSTKGAAKPSLGATSPGVPYHHISPKPAVHPSLPGASMSEQPPRMLMFKGFRPDFSIPPNLSFSAQLSPNSGLLQTQKQPKSQSDTTQRPVKGKRSYFF